MAHLRADRTLSGSTITGASRWGIPLYPVSSTRLGSTIMIFNSWGLVRKSKEAIKAFIHTDLPEPVLPAMRTWGILLISATIGVPDTSRPRLTANLLL